MIEEPKDDRSHFGIAVTVIESVEELLAFRPDWDSFLKRVPPASPFQLPEWLVTWWSHFGSGKLHVAVFRSGREVVGVVPGFLHTWNERRQLTLLGTGLTDYLDPLVDEIYLPAVYACLQLHLGESTAWDICDWQDLLHEIPLRGNLELRSDMPCSRVPLAPSFEQYLGARPKDLQRNLRKYREKARTAGSVRFDVTTRADPLLLDALIDLHAIRWQTQGQSGMIEANHASQFLRDAAVALSSVDALLIFTLNFQDKIAAIILALCDRTTIYGYLTGFHPEHEYYSFGRDLLARALQYAHDHDYRYWDFLRGEETYKREWGAIPVPKRRLLLTR